MGANGLCLGGGVAANSSPREQFLDVARPTVTRLLPSRPMCTDNAAMIGSAAWWRLGADGPSPLDTGVDPSLRLAVID